MPQSTYDLIVIGAGGVGSATMYYAASAGLKVLGIDRFSPPHDLGSSHGQTRVIRMAYFEHPDYVPLLKKAYQNWESLEQKSNKKLYHEVGLIESGPPDGVVIPGVLKSSHQHQLPLTQFTTAEAKKEFPGFDFPEGHHVVFEQRAGYLLVEQAIGTFIEEAKNHSAELNTEERFISWNEQEGTIHVTTDKRNYPTKKLVITTGAWANDSLGISLPLQVVRKHLYWYGCDRMEYAASKGCPVFFYELANQFYYGFPMIDQQTGIKVSRHDGGELILDPSKLSSEIDEEDQQSVLKFLNQHLPNVSSNLLKHSVCMYTLTPDDHFILDQHPTSDNVFFTAGLSGHGFKFTSVLGELLSEKAQGMQPSLPYEFLSLERLKRL